MKLLRLKVIETVAETPLIRRVVFAAADGRPLPAYEAAAHITLHMPGVGRRKYSLLNADPAADATGAPHTYTIGVRREDTGQGGSRWVHALKVGDVVEAEPPGNDFPLAAGTGPVMLVAGGIGVTPMITKAAALRAAGRPFRFVYASRARNELAFMNEINALAGDALTLHLDDEAGRVLDMTSLVDSLGPDEPLYICGPRPMIKAAMTEAKARGWPKDRLRFELFFTVADAPPVAAPVQPQPAEAATGGT